MNADEVISKTRNNESIRQHEQLVTLLFLACKYRVGLRVLHYLMNGLTEMMRLARHSQARQTRYLSVSWCTDTGDAYDHKPGLEKLREQTFRNLCRVGNDSQP